MNEKGNRKKRWIVLLTILPVTFIVLCILVYSKVYTKIDETLMYMIFENQIGHFTPLNSDHELDQELFSEISWYNKENKYWKGDKKPNYRLMMVGRPRIVHWFIGAKCEIMISYYTYDMDSEDRIHYRYSNIAIPVTIGMSLHDGRWEMVSFEARLIGDE